MEADHPTQTKQIHFSGYMLVISCVTVSIYFVSVHARIVYLLKNRPIEPPDSEQRMDFLEAVFPPHLDKPYKEGYIHTEMENHFASTHEDLPQ